jgi:hypothetical protein
MADQARIEVAENAKDVRIVLANLDIQRVFNNEASILINSGAEAIITLADGTSNHLVAGHLSAALRVRPGASLTIDGNGSLTAVGNALSAGIGGGYYDFGCGEIIINSGNVTAVGGEDPNSYPPPSVIIAATGFADTDNIITITWFTNRYLEGEFVMDMGEGSPWTSGIHRQQAVENIFEYSHTFVYEPQQEWTGELMFQVRQRDNGFDSYSNIVYLYFADGVVSNELKDRSGDPDIGVEIEDGVIKPKQPRPPLGNPYEWKPTTELGWIIYNAGFSYDLESGLLYSRMDAKQRQLGFAYFFDEGIPLISSNISCEPVYFIYDNKEWLIEIWKGQYGMELGAEIGVYNRTADGHLVKDRLKGNYRQIVDTLLKEAKDISKNSLPSWFVVDPFTPVYNSIQLASYAVGPAEFETALQAAYIFTDTFGININGIAETIRDAIGAVLFGLRSKLYDTVPDEEMLQMSYRLMDAKDVLFERGPKNHWWLTGFEWGAYTSTPHNLTMDATIWFPNEDMREAFLFGFNNHDEKAPFEVRDRQIYESNAFYNNDNFRRMDRGLAAMGYVPELTFNSGPIWNPNIVTISSIDDYLNSPYNTNNTGAAGMSRPVNPNMYEVFEGEHGYGVRFLIKSPLATQPFFTARLASTVNAGNKIVVEMYKKIKRMVGCPTDDPNDLEEYVLRFINGVSSSDGDKNFVSNNYQWLTTKIAMIVDSAFNVAMAAMTPDSNANSVMRMATTSVALAAIDETSENLPYGAYLCQGLGGDHAVIAINGGTLTAYGGIKGTIAALPSSYTYWMNVIPGPIPLDSGATVPLDTGFINNSIYKYVRIETEMKALTFNVTFVDWDGTVLKTETVERGSDATAPDNPVRDGHTFTGWDVSFTNITGDLIVTAKWEPIAEAPITSLKIDSVSMVSASRNSTLAFCVILNEGASDVGVVWSVSDPSVATANADGTVTIHNKAGMVMLTATDPESGLFHMIVLRVS